MYWLLTWKAKSMELHANERELIREKSRSAHYRAKDLLAIEQSIVPHSKDHNFANILSSRTANAIMKKEVLNEQKRAIRESKANNNRDKDNIMDQEGGHESNRFNQDEDMDEEVDELRKKKKKRKKQSSDGI